MNRSIRVDAALQADFAALQQSRGEPRTRAPGVERWHGRPDNAPRCRPSTPTSTSCRCRPGHRFPIGKYRLLRERVAADSPDIDAARGRAGERRRTRAGPHAGLHRSGRRRHARRGRAARDRLSVEQAMVERARRSVGATIAAARAALAEGVAANLAGGTHHAYADRGGGYCVFNDVAVAARLMQAEWHGAQRALLRVAVIDLDVHQGNGTAAIFAGDADRVHALAARREELPVPQGGERPRRRPARRLRRRRLPGRARRRARRCWRASTRRAVGLVFYLAGADPHEGDRLGRLKLTGAGLRARPARVRCARRAASRSRCDGRRLRPRLEDTVAVQAATIARSRLARWRDGPTQRLTTASRGPHPPMRHARRPTAAPAALALSPLLPLTPAGWTTTPTATSTTSSTTASSTPPSTPADRGRRARHPRGAVIGLVVETSATTSRRSRSRSGRGRLRVAHRPLSVRYEIGLFAAGADETRPRPLRPRLRRPRTRRPVPLPERLLAS